MKIKQTLLILALLIGLGGFFLEAPVSALTCGGATTSIIGCTQDNTGTDIKNSGIWGILMTAINILSVGVGIAAVGGIVYGAILYTTAGGSMEETKIAKKLILNVVFGIVTYALMFSFLNFIIPGGLFSK